MSEHLSHSAGASPRPLGSRQQLLEFALAQAPVILYIAEPDGERPMSFVSANVERITGHRPEDFLFNPGFEREQVHPDDLPEFDQSLRELEQNRAASNEHRFHTASGDIVWFRHEMRIAETGDCDESQIVGCMVDITAEKEAEAKLREAEHDWEHLSQLLHDAVEALPSGFSINDPEGDLVLCNTAYADQYGMTPGDMIGSRAIERTRQFLSNVRQIDGKPVKTTEDEVSNWARWLSETDKAPVEVELESGEWRLITSSATSEGGVARLRTDITSQKKAELALRESEQHFRSIVEGHPLPVWMVDMETAEVLYESPATAQLMGHEWQPRIAHYAFEHYADPKDREPLQEWLLKEGELRNARVQFKKADGTLFWVALNGKLINYAGHVVNIVTISDLTESMQREAELRQAREVLEDAIESLPEGFALFGADDRLVICNAKFREFNDLSADVLVPGVKWHDFVRAGAERGQYKDAIGRADEWMAERERYHSLGVGEARGVEFEQHDGRWFHAFSQSTRQGGYVGIRIDITEPKRMELALRESEQHFRSIVEGHPLPVWMVDMESAEILYESPAAARLMGRDWPSQKPGYTSDYFADPSDRDPLNERLREQGELRDVECQFKKADETLFWAAISDRLINYAGREVSITSFTDLTERKQREAELRQAREILEDAIESFPEGFALWDADYNLVLCNSRFREFNELSADMLVPGVNWLDYIRAGAERGQYVDAIGRVDEFVKQRLRNRDPAGPPSRGWEFQQSNGHWYYAYTRYTRQGSVVLVRIDITERKEMELALRESEERIRHVLEACPVPIRMSRAEDGKILYENPSTKALFGGMPADNPGLAVGFFVNPDDRVEYVSALREQGAVDDYEMQLKRADGTVFRGAVSARLIEYQGDEVIVSSTKDLTERLAIEEQMARQRESVYQSEKLSAMGKLLAGVAHELNNPLSVVVGQALLLRETAADERTANKAEKIGDAADRCARIVKTFLAMARERPGEMATVDVNDIIQMALEVAGYTLRSSDIDVSVGLAPDLPPVWADANQLNQVLTNLIVNAQHALEEKETGRSLVIGSGVDEPNGEVTIRVEDNGPGIPAELQPRIFEPLFTTKEIGVGTGIGLAVCHRIIDSHGGRIRAESTPGESTAFIIHLPLTTGEEERPTPAADIEQTVATLSALVIDDEPEVAELLAEMLRIDGHDAEIACSGAEALVKFEQREFDIILSDLRMPNLDGPGLFKAIAERNKALLDRVAFVTGDTVSPKARTFLESAGRPSIEKPVTLQAVRDLVREMSATRGAGPDDHG